MFVWLFLIFFFFSDFYTLDVDYVANEEVFKSSVPQQTEDLIYDSDADDEGGSEDE